MKKPPDTENKCDYPDTCPWFKENKCPYYAFYVIYKKRFSESLNQTTTKLESEATSSKKEILTACRLHSCVHNRQNDCHSVCALGLKYVIGVSCGQYQPKEDILPNQLPYWYIGSIPRRFKPYCTVRSCAYYYQEKYHRRCALGLRFKKNCEQYRPKEGLSFVRWPRWFKPSLNTHFKK